MSLSKELEQAKRRFLAAAIQATPGPWKIWAMSVYRDPVGDSNLDNAIPVADTFYRNDQGRPRDINAEFVAAARDVDRVIAAQDEEIRRLEDALHAVSSLAGDPASVHGGNPDEQRAAIFNACVYALNGKRIAADDYRPKNQRAR